MFGVGLVLVIGVLGYLGYTAVATNDSAPPDIEVVVGEPSRGEYGYLLPISAINHGDETAEGVLIEVTLERDGAEVEQGEFEIALLPRHATGEGWVAFKSDPASGQIVAEVSGFEKP